MSWCPAVAGAWAELSGGGPPLRAAALVADHAPLLAMLLRQASISYGTLLGRAVWDASRSHRWLVRASTRRADDDGDPDPDADAVHDYDDEGWTIGAADPCADPGLLPDLGRWERARSSECRSCIDVDPRPSRVRASVSAEMLRHGPHPSAAAWLPGGGRPPRTS